MSDTIGLMSDTIGFKCYEIIGQAMINPMIFVVETIGKNKQENTVNENNLSELIGVCFNYVPNRKDDILDRIARAFPHLIHRIDRYRMLI